MVSTEDIKAFSKIGRALWSDPEHSDHSTLETLTAVTLLELTAERAIEKAASVLLDQAKRQKASVSAFLNSNILATRFFRLPHEERLILAALHGGQWSYARLARILGCDAFQIEQMAWSARLQLVVSVPYPTGPHPIGPRCPDYDSTRPWTQRFLDDEIASSRDRIFLQNHLFACLACRDALSRSRKVFFHVEQEVLKILEDQAGHSREVDVVEALNSVVRQNWINKHPSERSFIESLAIFVKRPDIQWLLLGAGTLMVWKLLRLLFSSR